MAPWLVSLPPNGSISWDGVSTFQWSPRDNYEGGYYRIISNQSGVSQGWTLWTNGTNHVVGVDTSQLTTWEYVIEYNDSVGNLGIPNKVIRTVVDTQNPWDNNPADAIITYGVLYNLGWQLYDNSAPGLYRILRNTSEVLGWTFWANGSPTVAQTIDTSSLTVWEYVIEYNDSQGNPSTDTVYIRIIDDVFPWADPPTDASYNWDDTINISFRLYDNYAGGQYRITSNSSYSKGWTFWSNGTLIEEAIANLTSGAWSFTLEFTDNVGLSGDPITITIIVGEEPSNGGIPGFSLLFGLFGLVAIAVNYSRKKHSWLKI